VARRAFASLISPRIPDGAIARYRAQAPPSGAGSRIVRRFEDLARQQECGAREKSQRVVRRQGSPRQAAPFARLGERPPLLRREKLSPDARSARFDARSPRFDARSSRFAREALASTREAPFGARAPKKQTWEGVDPLAIRSVGRSLIVECAGLGLGHAREPSRLRAWLCSGAPGWLCRAPPLSYLPRPLRPRRLSSGSRTACY
jgi:hypothetical protein